MCSCSLAAASADRPNMTSSSKVVKAAHSDACVLQARALLVINHVSYLDALVMGQVFMPCGLAKSAVTNIPCVGILACALQVTPL